MRYTFGDFVLSPGRRLLIRSGREVEIAPRTFDLLVLLVHRRHEVVTRREIFDVVWSDVVVSDGALTQAVRTLRRTLGDDPRTARYVRTVLRHGYQFVYPEVLEGDDGAPLPPVRGHEEGDQPEPCDRNPDDELERALAELLSDAPDEARLAAAETLHSLGTERTLARLGGGASAARARALLRDARWELAEAGEVPILGRPRSLAALGALFSLRLRRVWREAGSRFLFAVAGATMAGLFAGALGGLALLLGPGSQASASLPALLALVGAAIGAAGASGVAAGLCSAEVLVRSRRGLALVVCGAAGGGVVGFAAHGLGRFLLEGLFGQDLSPVAGGFEGLVLGAAAGLGYALATPRPSGGMATPRGSARWRAALAAGGCCALAAAILSAAGSYLGAMSLDLLAHRFPGSEVGLEPLARLLGEPTPGPATRIAIGAWEGLWFAAGTIFGLTHRPPRARVTDR
ncbi:MAG TPA: winged helix-turn-helix domain-containing protein [Thermoanaerobaculia bacterium]|nr:winged helix-turn-helix domain-containing protein [Thermoanaerobaculia bacterium]